MNGTLVFGVFSKMHRCADPFYRLKRIFETLLTLKEFRASFDAFESPTVVFGPVGSQPIRDGARDPLPVLEDLTDLSQKHRVYE